MMYWSVIIVSLISFFSTFFCVPFFISFLQNARIIGTDQQKKGKPKLPSSGGLAVGFGVMAGLMCYIGFVSFVFGAANLTYLLAASCSFLIALLVGIADDLNIGIKKVIADTGTKCYRIGLKQWQKPFLVLFAAVPLMAVEAGNTTVIVPVFGVLNLGLIYPLVLVPLAFVCVSNAYNMLAGFNGLEAGLGIVASFSLGLYALLNNSMEATVLSFILCGALLGFIKYNWFPAKILPGDSLTYLVGSVLVTIVILGNMERFGVIVFIPWVIEAFLKLRGKFKVSSLGTLQADGTLKTESKKICSLTHLVMKIGKFKEEEVTSVIILIEALICAFAFFVCLSGLI